MLAKLKDLGFAASYLYAYVLTMKDSLSAKHLIVYGSRYGGLPINLTNCVKSVKYKKY